MATTENLGIEKIDADVNQGGVTANEALDVFDAAHALKSLVMTDANYTVGTTGTPADWQYGTLKFTGTLGADRNVVVPDNKKSYSIINGTTGGFAITVKTASGTGIAVAAGKAAIVACDGTNVVRITPDT
jgi:hypothetical protein